MNFKSLIFNKKYFKNELAFINHIIYNNFFIYFIYKNSSIITYKNANTFKQTYLLTYYFSILIKYFMFLIKKAFYRSPQPTIRKIY